MGNTNILLSIIIPVYNVRDYIAKCLESIDLQNIEKSLYEVIVVNDGTPDDSMDIARPILQRMGNTKIINQENQGLSAARNTGLEKAQGEYVWFVDSDDWLLPEAIKKVLMTIQNHKGIDVIASILEMHYEEKQIVKNEYDPNSLSLTGKEYLQRRYPQGASQRFILRRQFLEDHQLYFCKGLLHEDGLFGYTMLYWAKDVLILSEPIYAYRIRQSGSIMSNISMRTPQSMLFIHKQLMAFCDNVVTDEDFFWYRQEIFKVLINLFAFSGKLAFDKEFASFYQSNQTYFNQESQQMINAGVFMTKAMIMRYCPLTIMRIKYILKKMLKK